MEITYLGHSCMALAHDGFKLIIDPYAQGTVPGLSDIRESANQVICSHDHTDHNGIDRIDFVQARLDTPFAISGFRTYHDDCRGERRGQTIVHIIRAEDMTVVHMGDVGCMISEEEAEEIRGCDILMIPVGGYYTIDAQTAREYVDMLSPGIVIPMHYKGDGFGFEELSGVEDFVNLFEQDMIDYCGSTINTDSGLRTGRVAVMTPLNAIRTSNMNK